MADAAVTQLRALFFLSLRSLPGEEGWAGGGLGGRQGVASWRKEAGEGQGCPGSGTFPFSNNKKPRPWGGERGPRPQPHQPGQDTSSRPPPPTSQPCPAFPVNTSTSSGGRAWRCWGEGGHTRRPASPAHNGWPGAPAGPSNSPGLPCDPEKCHPWRELDAPLAQEGHASLQGHAGPPAAAPSTLTAACSVLEVKALGRGTHSEASLPGVSKHLVLRCLPARQHLHLSFLICEMGGITVPISSSADGEDSVS